MDSPSSHGSKHYNHFFEQEEQATEVLFNLDFIFAKLKLDLELNLPLGLKYKHCIELSDKPGNYCRGTEVSQVCHLTFLHIVVFVSPHTGLH